MRVLQMHPPRDDAAIAARGAGLMGVLPVQGCRRALARPSSHRGRA